MLYLPMSNTETRHILLSGTETRYVAVFGTGSRHIRLYLLQHWQFTFAIMRIFCLFLRVSKVPRNQLFNDIKFLNYCTLSDVVWNKVIIWNFVLQNCVAIGIIMFRIISLRFGIISLRFGILSLLFPMMMFEVLSFVIMSTGYCQCKAIHLQCIKNNFSVQVAPSRAGHTRQLLRQSDNRFEAKTNVSSPITTKYCV